VHVAIKLPALVPLSSTHSCEYCVVLYENLLALRLMRQEEVANWVNGNNNNEVQQFGGAGNGWEWNGNGNGNGGADTPKVSEMCGFMENPSCKVVAGEKQTHTHTHTPDGECKFMLELIATSGGTGKWSLRSPGTVTLISRRTRPQTRH